MRIMMVIPPVYLWNYIPDSRDNFLTPLGLLSLASSLHRRFGADGKTVDIRIFDGSAEHVGWKTLARRLREWRPGIVVTTFRDTFNAPDHGRVASLAKELDPRVKVIGGGIHATELPEDTMARWPLDAIALQEGEETICELVEEYSKAVPDLASVKGIVYRSEGEVVRTAPRPLLDLQFHPIEASAYKLVHMPWYRPMYMWGGVTVEGSRGCIGSCNYCSFWSFMSHHEMIDGVLVKKPCIRFRPVEQVLDQLELLYKVYGKREFFMVDSSFGVDPSWTTAFADGMIRRGLNMRFTAFMRSDLIVRDQGLGVLEHLVKAGLVMALIGVERATDEDMKLLNKPIKRSVDIEAFRILGSKYPHVVRMALCIIGMKHETPSTMRQLGQYLAEDLDADIAAPHPLTPFPGTELWNQMPQEWRDSVDLRDINMIYPLIPCDNMTPDEICIAANSIQKNLLLRPRHIAKLVSPHSRQRSMKFHFWTLAVKSLMASVRHLQNPQLATRCMWAVSEPPWYNT